MSFEIYQRGWTTKEIQVWQSCTGSWVSYGGYACDATHGSLKLCFTPSVAILKRNRNHHYQVSIFTAIKDDEVWTVEHFVAFFIIFHSWPFAALLCLAPLYSRPSCAILCGWWLYHYIRLPRFFVCADLCAIALDLWKPSQMGTLLLVISNNCYCWLLTVIDYHSWPSLMIQIHYYRSWLLRIIGDWHWLILSITTLIIKRDNFCPQPIIAKTVSRREPSSIIDHHHSPYLHNH